MQNSWQAVQAHISSHQSGLTRETRDRTNTDYLYDANGSLTKKDDGTNVHSYAYDFRNLMTDYDGPGSSNDSTYKYDASGRRITKDVNGTKTAYFHDGLNVVAEYNGSNQLQRTYVTPGLDQNVSLTSSGSTYYYLSDALGSIRQVIDANEATQNSYDYFAFGKVYGTPTENLTQPFRFTARAWDGETELYYYRARNYAAKEGRFISRDPIYPLWEESAYGYVSNVPILFADPLGLTKPYVKRTETRIEPHTETKKVWVDNPAYGKVRATKTTTTMWLEKRNVYGQTWGYQLGDDLQQFGKNAQYAGVIAVAIPEPTSTACGAMLVKLGGAVGWVGLGINLIGYLLDSPDPCKERPGPWERVRPVRPRSTESETRADEPLQTIQPDPNLVPPPPLRRPGQVPDHWEW